MKPVVLFISPDASRTGAPLCLGALLLSVTKDAPFSANVFVTGDGPLAAEWRHRNLPVTVTEKRVRGKLLYKLWSRLRSLFAYLKLLRRVRPALIYSNTMRNGIEVIVGRLLGIHTIVHVHEGEQIMRQYATSLRALALFTSRFICVSRYSADSLKKIVRRDAVVVHNGIAFDKPLDGSMPAMSRGGILRIGMVGGIQPNKGQHVTIEAIHELVRHYKLDARLLIFGEVENAEYREALDELMRKLAVGSLVEFRGAVADREAIYRSVDVVVVASRDESFSLVTLEAFAFGKPVVATAVGGIPEIVKSEENGILVPPDDARRLAGAIARLATEPALALRLTRAAAEDVRRRFQLNDAIAQLRAQIEGALGLGVRNRLGQ